MKTATIARWTVHLLALLPLLELTIKVVTQQIGPDPAEAIVRDLGFWALLCLWCCLAMTPLRHLTGQPHWIAMRRPLGLWAFAYGSLHLAAFVIIWAGVDTSIVLDEVKERPYILLGVGAWLTMLPLAATSTRKARVALGPRWNQLHRLVYLAALLGLIHLLLIAKLDYVKFLAFSIALIFLFFLRFINRQRRQIAI